MNQLLIVEACEGCGVCCMEQQSPPGYVMLLSSHEMMEAELFADDAERLKSLPDEAVQELRQYMKLLLADEISDGDPCLWLDQKTMRCRYHEYRPSICREFEVGGDDCLGWRWEYRIDD